MRWAPLLICASLAASVGVGSYDYWTRLKAVEASVAVELHEAKPRELRRILRNSAVDRLSSLRQFIEGKSWQVPSARDGGSGGATGSADRGTGDSAAAVAATDPAALAAAVATAVSASIEQMEKLLAAASQSAVVRSKKEKLLELNALRDDGLLEPGEYEAQRAKIMDAD